mmetsp:Transcript_119621/g.343626  ORF Transcript_119621/g.343626 Transcript_119621/m.343626 type:complete len:294 (+) Transcript_119621:59-940(+)
MTTTGINKHDEPEITVETPPPIPVTPPIVTTCVATPVDVTAENSTSIVSTPTSQPKPTTCTVFAPATLSAGYTFPARVDGIDFVVTVPDGGAMEGQSFQVPYPSTVGASPSAEQPTAVTPLELVTSHQIPTGKWRNDIWDCCEVIHTGIFWQALFCTPILLGQILTRNHLNPLDMPHDSRVSYCQLFAGIWVVCLVLVLLAIVGVAPGGLVLLVWPLVITIVTAMTRFMVRHKYQIPIKCCTGFGGSCDDICCGVWCACCVSIQMARHTHPPNEFPYDCCSPTGLEQGTPEIA